MKLIFAALFISLSMFAQAQIPPATKGTVYGPKINENSARCTLSAVFALWTFPLKSVISCQLYYTLYCTFFVILKKFPKFRYGNFD